MSKYYNSFKYYYFRFHTIYLRQESEVLIMLLGLYRVIKSAFTSADIGWYLDYVECARRFSYAQFDFKTGFSVGCRTQDLNNAANTRPR